MATIDDATATYTPAGSVGDSTLTVVNSWGDDGTANVTIAGGTFTGTEATIDIVAPATYKTGN